MLVFCNYLLFCTTGLQMRLNTAVAISIDFCIRPYAADAGHDAKEVPTAYTALHTPIRYEAAVMARFSAPASSIHKSYGPTVCNVRPGSGRGASS